MMKSIPAALLKGARRAVAIGLFLAAGAPHGVAQTAAPGPSVNWDFSVYTPPTSSAIAGMSALADLLKERTGGRFVIKTHWSGTLAPAKETLDAIKLGAFQMGMVAQSYHPGKIPTTNVFDLPFLQFGSLPNQLAVMRAYFHLPEVVADAARWNAVILMPSILTPYELAGRGKAPRRLEDFGNLRIRAPGGMGEALKKIGVTPNNIPGPELYGALDRGLIDGLAFPFYAHWSYKTGDLVSWYTTNLELGIVCGYGVVNKAAWDDLPRPYQKLMTDLVPKAQEIGMPRILEDNQRVLDTFKARNVEPVTFTREDRDRLVQIGARPIWDKWVADMNAAGYPGAKLLDFVLMESVKGVN